MSRHPLKILTDIQRNQFGVQNFYEGYNMLQNSWQSAEEADPYIAAVAAVG